MLMGLMGQNFGKKKSSVKKQDKEEIIVESEEEKKHFKLKQKIINALKFKALAILIYY